ncbi:MAG TPA: HD domain-containing protein [Candidatus Limnocylindrales bacterium]
MRHSRAVAEVAAWLARRIAERQPLDRGLAETAALLHDVDKAMPRRSRPDGLGHGAAGGAWLAGHGHPELLEVVALHPVTRLAEPDGWVALERASLEARIVAYADKRAQQRLVSMAARFARWDQRHPHGWTKAVRAEVWSRARMLEDEVCDAASCAPEDVGRLAWTGAAFTAEASAAVRAAAASAAGRAAATSGPEGRDSARLRSGRDAA